MAAGSVGPAEVRSALRALLRAVDRHLTPVNGSRQWRDEVLAQFRRPYDSHTPALQSSPSSSLSPPSALARGSPGAGSAASQAPPPHAATSPIAPAGVPPTPAQAVALARDMAYLMSNIAQHRELLLSYNIGLDVDERTRRMVEATARRVGFALPEIKPQQEP